MKQSFVSNVTTSPGSTSSTGSRSGPNAQITSSRETRCSVATAIDAAILSVPRRRVVHPAAADHRRDDLHLAQLLRLAGERVAVEDDEVGEAARERACRGARSSCESQAGATHVACSACSSVRPAGPRASGRGRRRRRRPTGRAPRSARPSRSRRAAPESSERAERVRAVGRSGPEALRELLVGRRVRELDRRRRRRAPRSAGTSSGARHCACSIRWRSPRGCHTSRVALERVERVAVRAVADRVHADRPARLGALAHDLLELLAARDLDARAVEHPARSASRASRP